LPPEANTVYWLLHAHQGHNFMPFVRGPTLWYVLNIYQ
jgi:hypothetical protein